MDKLTLIFISIMLGLIVIFYLIAHTYLKLIELIRKTEYEFKQTNLRILKLKQELIKNAPKR